MENLKEKCEKTVKLLDEIISLIIADRGLNSFEDLEKAKKIISQKNVNQFNLVIKKLDNFTMLFYNQRFSNTEEIINKLNQIYETLNGDEQIIE